MSTAGYLLHCGVSRILFQLMVDEISPEALAARLRQALDRCGKQQTDLAALFEISDAAVSKWLKTGKIGRDRLPGLARFLAVNLQWLAEGKGPMTGEASPRAARDVIQEIERRTIAHELGEAELSLILDLVKRISSPLRKEG